MFNNFLGPQNGKLVFAHGKSNTIFIFFYFFAFKQEKFATGATLKNVKENICVLNLRLEAKFSEALHPKSRQL